MFLCKISEFGSPQEIVIANNRLYWRDKYFFYDEYLHPLHAVDTDLYGIFYVDDGAWIEYKDGTGKIIAKHLTFDAWGIGAVKNHRYCYGSVTIGEKIFVVDGRRKDKKILLCCGDNEVASVNIPWVERYLKAYGKLIYAYAGQTIHCFDSSLKSVWSEELDAEVLSTYIEVDTSNEMNAILIVYFGSDSTSYGLRAYRSDNGDLVWERKFEAKASGVKISEGKIYLCCKGVFIRLNALAGTTEVDQLLSFEKDDGSWFSISAVVPIKNKILCFYEQSKFIEVRTKDAKILLQKITLPETLFVFPSEPSVLEHAGRYYFGLEHQVMWLNPMKSAHAVLRLDNAAPEDCEATFESRPPYTVEPIKDSNGKNGFYIRMEGDDPEKIIRYANVVLKELAYMNGKTSEIEFESRDHDNAGVIILEVNTNNLPSNRNISEWTEIFSVIKERTEDELSINGVKAGDGESNFVIDLRVL
ncbi:hypothetical protein [Cellvibrio sp. NN19]|uniref:hypothetical protein n=1 Tax=Cellvibrio chitinivorans TaxID=3102792 RepID=UPI002B40D270|nr:hypothetical protein [Cellvibrio sp. NN19]